MRKHAPIIILGLTVSFLLGVWYGKTEPIPLQNKTARYTIVEVKPTSSPISPSAAQRPTALFMRDVENTSNYIRAQDVTGDGIDELIIDQKSASWWGKTYIYKISGGKVELLCKHCAFITHGGSALIDKEGILTNEGRFIWNGTDFEKR